MAGYPQCLPLGLVILAFPLAWGAWESKASDTVRAVVARGTPKDAFVVSKFTRTSSGSKNSSPTRSHYVRLRVGTEAFDRRIGQDVYERLEDSIRVPWYDDPAVPGGFSELEVGILTDDQAIGYLLGILGCLAIPRVCRKALPGSALVSVSHSFLDDASPIPDRDALAPGWRAQQRARSRLAARVLGGFILVGGGIAAAFLAAGTPGAAWVALVQAGVAILCTAWILGRTAYRDRVLWREGRVCRGRVVMAWPGGGWTRLTVQVEAPRSTLEAVRWLPGHLDLPPESRLPALVIDGDPVRVAPVPPETAP